MVGREMMMCHVSVAWWCDWPLWAYCGWHDRCFACEARACHQWYYRWAMWAIRWYYLTLSISHVGFLVVSLIGDGLVKRLTSRVTGWFRIIGLIDWSIDWLYWLMNAWLHVHTNTWLFEWLGIERFLFWLIGWCDYILIDSLVDRMTGRLKD